jgi:hypothetical protein
VGEVIRRVPVGLVAHVPRHAISTSGSDAALSFGRLTIMSSSSRCAADDGIAKAIVQLCSLLIG